MRPDCKKRTRPKLKDITSLEDGRFARDTFRFVGENPHNKEATQTTAA